MRLDNMTISCDIKNNPEKFINHSCDPNCVLEIKDHKGTPHACVVAKNRIHSGLELTIHYNWELKQDDPFTECLCGSRKCDCKIEKLFK
jgi:SET domain-containing protein